LALVGYDSNMPTIGGGVTVVGSTFVSNADMTIINNSLTVDPTVCILRNADPQQGAGGSVIKLSIDRVTGKPAVTVWDKVTHTPPKPC